MSSLTGPPNRGPVVNTPEERLQLSYRHRQSRTTMEYIRKLKLFRTITKKRQLISKWKSSRRPVSAINRQILLSTRRLRKPEDSEQEVVEHDTFLSREILDQMKKSLHQKKSLRSVIEEAKSELAVKKQELRLVDSREDYVDMALVNLDTHNSDYMEMF